MLNLKRQQEYLKAKSPKDVDFLKHKMESDKIDALSKIAEIFKNVETIKLKGDKGDPAPAVDEEALARKIFKMIRIPVDGKNGIDGRPGKDADEEQIVKKIIALLPKPKDGKDGAPGRHGKDGFDGKDAALPDLRDLAINTINILESLEDDDRLDIKSIKGVKEYVLTFVDQQWGGPGIVFHDSTLMGSGVPGDPLKVTNPGGGGSTTVTVFGEIVAGSGTAFTLAKTPIGNISLAANGQILNTANGDYTIFNGAITTAESWPSGSLVASYLVSGTNVIFGEIVSGSNTTFTLAKTPASTIDVSANGQVLTLNVDYTISGAIITTVESWPAGSVLANYAY